jgi:hypothetical protein
MGHLGCLHSISAERPVKNHFRSVSIELAQAARTTPSTTFQVFSTKQSFCNGIMVARHADSLFPTTNSEDLPQDHDCVASALVSLLVADIEALARSPGVPSQRNVLAHSAKASR